MLSLSAFVLLLAFWLLLSGYFTPFLVAAGIGSAVAVVLFGRRMEIVDREGSPDLSVEDRDFVLALAW